MHHMGEILRAAAGMLVMAGLFIAPTVIMCLILSEPLAWLFRRKNHEHHES